MEDAYTQARPVGRVIGRNLGHTDATGIGEPYEGPLVVLRCVKAKRALVAFELDFLPQRPGAIRAAPSRCAFEAITEFRPQLVGGHRREAAKQAVRGED